MNMAESRELKDRIEALEKRVAELESPMFRIPEGAYVQQLKGELFATKKTLSLKK